MTFFNNESYDNIFLIILPICKKKMNDISKMLQKIKFTIIIRVKKKNDSINQWQNKNYHQIKKKLLTSIVSLFFF